MAVAVDAPRDPLSIVVGHPEASRCRVRIAGRLDETTARPLGGVLADLRAEGCAVDVDLAAVVAADIAGMLPLWEACLDAGLPRVRIVAASAEVRALVDVVLHLVGDPPARDRKTRLSSR